MKSALLGIVSLLLLTGCSTASTDPKQAVKLIEYEKCLDLYILRNADADFSTFDTYADAFSGWVVKCERFKP